MSTDSYDEILKAALALPYEQRWKLVEAIDETLHPPPKYKTEEEFQAMLQQRIEDVESGRAEFVDAEEVFRQIRETLAQKRGKLLFE